MSYLTLQRTILASSISFSFILVGNAVTQSFMTVPALLLNFPLPGGPDYITRTAHLGAQWPLLWAVGNRFFRPISTFGIIGYAFSAFAAHTNDTGFGKSRDWRFLAVAAVCHFVNVVHSAVNMQPLNEKLEGLAREGHDGKGNAQAREWAERWRRRNLVRLVLPAVAGVLALGQAVV
ncbi:hypothetical protein M501DRAFT_1017301 [Patellaria atrata CBS 101060]|uniref:DUF1772-domain-containing protein n=1 Tax=Patellaria atrata CBS 101060 TaxID=1346257 RepID=A0A9P4SAP6_9PEZI|nr:hypothetical protein M501DRAFT_1017301 [Patellaria atrata CBS 101060]